MNAFLTSKNRWAGALALTAAAVLAGCGGSQRVENYEPTSVVSFGDELSLVTSAGKKYSVNALSATDSTVVDCATYPTWNQYLANNFGLAFDVCKGSAITATGVTRAAEKAKVADAVAQVSQYLADHTLTPKTMATVLVGQYDVKEAFDAVQAMTLTHANALTQVGTVAKTLAALVNKLANNGDGARVVYSTVPDLSLSPYGRSLSADQQALLTELTQTFNTEFRSGVINDGRYAGLVQADAELTVITTYPSTYGVTEVTQAACTAALPDCSTATLQSAAASNGLYYLWADSLRPGPAFHTRLGTAAASRARNNPF